MAKMPKMIDDAAEEAAETVAAERKEMPGKAKKPAPKGKPMKKAFGRGK